MFLNEDLQPGRLVQTIQSRSNILGLISLQADEDDPVEHLTVSYLLLAHTIELAVTRTNGDPVYVGEGQVERGTLQFMLRETGLARISTDITGRVSADDIQLSLQVGQERRRPKKQGVAI